MKIITIICSASILLSSCGEESRSKVENPTAEVQKDLTKMKSQMEINIDAEDEYIKTKKKLENLYNKILKDYSSDTIFINNLIASQDLWWKFREAEILMKYPKDDYYRDGSAFNLCYFNYLTELTATRIETLKKWDEGSEEGDYCSGTIRNKNH